MFVLCASYSSVKDEWLKETRGNVKDDEFCTDIIEPIIIIIIS